MRDIDNNDVNNNINDNSESMNTGFALSDSTEPEVSQAAADETVNAECTSNETVQSEDSVIETYCCSTIQSEKEQNETVKDETLQNETVQNMEGAYSSGTNEYQKMRERAAKKEMKNAAKKNKTQKHRHGFWFKAVSVVMCAIVFGAVSAGAFLGVLHVTGYDNKMESAIEAANKGQESAVHVNTVSSTNTQTAGDSEITQVVQNTLPSVVSITSKIVYESQGYGFFFNGGQQYETSGAGSGIIVGQNDTELLIVTNNHVVEGATSLMVSFVDGEDVAATVKSTSANNDLAVVAVQLSDIKESTLNSISAATFGDSDSLQLGDRVIAIGNALGYGQSVTVGYVSALSRDVTIEGNTMTLLQTDAAINPGNSGGALINEKGELVGINSAKYSDTNVEGMGFAIPISSVKDLIEELMNKEPLKEVDESEASYLGITPAAVDSSTAYLYNMPEGVYIYSLTENGPAAQSGLKEKDIITKFDGEKITSTTDLQNILKYYAGGTTVDVTVERVVDGQYQEIVIPVKLGLKSDYQTQQQ